MPRYSWTQPICESCYYIRHPRREPVKLIETEREVCVDCGRRTRAGIYIRVNPDIAKHPTNMKDG
jgi:hypothetical protein